MKIALVSQEYPPETAKGGLATQTYLKAHGMAARGHEVHVISQTLEPKRFDADDGPVRVTRTPGFYQRMDIQTEAAGWLTHSAEVAAVLWELHAQKKFDLVDFPEWGGEGYIHLLNRLDRTPPVAVVQLHSPLAMFAHTMQWPEKDSDFYRIGTEMEKTCLRLADAVFSSSECAIEWCRKYYGLTRPGIPVIHTGVDTSLFCPKEVAKAPRPTIVFVGRIVRNKGVEALLAACCQAANDFPDLQLLMIGNGDADLIGELRTMAAGHGCSDLLELCGFVPSEKLPEQLSIAHVFAAPSIYEGGPGFVYLEAMACGLPVIGCEGSGVSEVITHGETGILVPPNDIDALTRALCELLKDAKKRDQLGRAAREFVVKHAERESCLDRINTFYLQVVEGAK